MGNGILFLRVVGGGRSEENNLAKPSPKTVATLAANVMKTAPCGACSTRGQAYFTWSPQGRTCAQSVTLYHPRVAPTLMLLVNDLMDVRPGRAPHSLDPFWSVSGLGEASRSYRRTTEGTLMLPPYLTQNRGAKDTLHCPTVDCNFYRSFFTII